MDLIHKYKPEIVLVGATGLGRDLAGAAATALNAGLTADCTGLAIDARTKKEGEKYENYEDQDG